MSVGSSVEVLIGGLVAGSAYALIALGMSLIYAMSRVVNLAQGAFVVFAALVGVSLQNDLHLPGSLALIATAVIFAVGTALLELVVIRPGSRRATPDRMLLITVGVLQAVGGLLLLAWGNLPYTAEAFTRPAVVTIAGVRVPSQFFWVAGVLLVVLAALWFLLERTPLGLRMRATAQDPDAARLVGIDVDLMRLLAFGLAGAMAAVAGVALLPLTFLQYDTVVPYAVNGFIAAVLGGLGSAPGAVLGGLLLGVLQGFLQRYTSAPVAQMLSIAALVVLLVLRPSGLRGRLTEARR